MADNQEATNGKINLKPETMSQNCYNLIYLYLFSSFLSRLGIHIGLVPTSYGDPYLNDSNVAKLYLI